MASMCRDTYGSILFIAEAYSLFRDEDSPNAHGRKALDTLSSDSVVIMAGYIDEWIRLLKERN